MPRPLLLWLFGALSSIVVAGCASEQEQARERALLRALDTIRRETTVLESRIARPAQEERTASGALERIQRLITQFRLYRKVPEIPALDLLDHDLTIYSRAFGFDLQDFQAVPRNASRRTLPDTLAPDDDFAYRPDDLRDLVDVSFRLPRPDEGALGRWFHMLGSIGRLLLLTEIRPTPTGFIVRAEAYYFVESRPPRLERRPLSVETVLGGPEIRPALRRDPSRRADRRVREIEVSIERINRALPAYNRSLVSLAQARLLEARFAFFAERTFAVEDLALTTLTRH